MNVFEVKYELTDYPIINDDLRLKYGFKNISELIKNSITGGDILEIRVFDKDNDLVDCSYTLEMYKRLDQSESNQ